MYSLVGTVSDATAADEVYLACGKPARDGRIMPIFFPDYAFWHCHDFSPIMPNFMPKYANTNS